MSIVQIQDIDYRLKLVQELIIKLHERHVSFPLDTKMHYFLSRVAWEHLDSNVDAHFNAFTFIKTAVAIVGAERKMNDDFDLNEYANATLADKRFVEQASTALAVGEQETLRPSMTKEEKNTVANIVCVSLLSTTFYDEATAAPSLRIDHVAVRSALESLLPVLNQSDDFLRTVEELQHLGQTCISQFTFGNKYSFGNAAKAALITNEVFKWCDHSDMMSSDERKCVPHIMGKFSSTLTMIATILNVFSQNIADGCPFIGNYFFMLPFQWWTYKAVSLDVKHSTPIIIFIQGVLFIETSSELLRFDNVIDMASYWLNLIETEYGNELNHRDVNVKEIIKMTGLV